MEKIISKYISEWESRCYSKGIPDEVEPCIYELVPSYKKIALCILNNDLKPLGIKNPKSKYYSILKRIEIDQRKYEGKQLKLF